MSKQTILDFLSIYRMYQYNRMIYPVFLFQNVYQN